MQATIDPTLRVAIALGERSYEILIGGGLLDAAASFDGLPRSPCAVIVTDTTVAPLYAERLHRALSARHARVRNSASAAHAQPR